MLAELVMLGNVLEPLEALKGDFEEDSSEKYWLGSVIKLIGNQADIP
jgi:hypothetical protein